MIVEHGMSSFFAFELANSSLGVVEAQTLFSEFYLNLNWFQFRGSFQKDYSIHGFT